MALLVNPALGDRAPIRIPERAFRFAVVPAAALLFVIAAFLPRSLGLTVGDTLIYACLVPLFWLVITRPDGITGRILNNRAVAQIGVLSFSIYLLHRLVLAIVQLTTNVAPLVDLAALVIAVALAQVMYVAVEKPLGRARRRLETRMTTKEPAAGQA